MGESIRLFFSEFVAALRMFDTPERLNYSELPDYPAWYSCLKDEYVLTPKEFQRCKKTLKKRGEAKIRSLATLLQRSRSGTWVGSLEKNESILHLKRHRCSQPPRGEHALPLESLDRARG